MQKFIKEITRQAGQIVLKKFGKVGVKYTKRNIADVVTEADLAANDYLVEQIKSKYPDHGIISEESGEHQIDSEYTWIVDPLDGTRNFSVGTPLFGVIVGLARNNEMVMGAIADPSHKQLIFAEKGQSAYLNDKKIKCSDTKEWKQSYGSGFALINKNTAKILARLVGTASKEPFWINSFGCSAIAAMHLANGRRDWLISLNGQVWDMAAPAIIFQESGCVVSDIAGKPWTLKSKGLIAANPHLYKKLLRTIQTDSSPKNGKS